MERKNIVCMMIGHVKSEHIDEYYVFEGVRNMRYNLDNCPKELRMKNVYKRWSIFKGLHTFDEAIEKLAERIKLNNEGKAGINATIPDNKRKYRKREKAGEHSFINPRIRQSRVMRRIQ